MNEFTCKTWTEAKQNGPTPHDFMAHLWSAAMYDDAVLLDDVLVYARQNNQTVDTTDAIHLSCVHNRWDMLMQLEKHTPFSPEDIHTGLHSSVSVCHSHILQYMWDKAQALWGEHLVENVDIEMLMTVLCTTHEEHENDVLKCLHVLEPILTGRDASKNVVDSLRFNLFKTAEYLWQYSNVNVLQHYSRTISYPKVTKWLNESLMKHQSKILHQAVNTQKAPSRSSKKI